MQPAHLKLREILWEITSRCENGCSYCGSKEDRHREVDDNLILNIAKKIVDYPPESITITGGDPLLVSIVTHRKIIKDFKNANMECKILCNPLSLLRLFSEKTKFDVLKLYDWIGVSINTKRELDAFQQVLESDLWGVENYTIVSNFNIQNIFLFNKINNLVLDLDKVWQVQYTMHDIPDMNLYHPDNTEACNVFFGHITTAIKSKTKIVLADNLNNCSCGAGLCSLGILWDGTVVPCLSMRAWIDGVLPSEGHLEYDSTKLEECWKHRFDDMRFQEFKCCKDICNKPFKLPDNVLVIEDVTIKDAKELEDHLKKIWPPDGPFPRPDDSDDSKKWPGKDIVVVYGVVPERTVLYGVSPNTTYVYGVWNEKPSDSIISVDKTDSDDKIES